MHKGTKAEKGQARYPQLIERIFFGKRFCAYDGKKTEMVFERRDLELAAEELEIALPKNLGDVIYSIRYRQGMPEAILRTQPAGMQWIIEGIGSSKYKFCLSRINLIVPNANLATIKIPDATPEIIGKYALSDEQALLARVRYNRLVDIFLGITAYSLQNHLRTNIKAVGQLEIDEIYAGLDRSGAHYIVPVQAKGGSDRLAAVQTKQDYLYCRQQFPDLICRLVSAQFMGNERIAMFELTLSNDRVLIVDEKHYLLVAADQISPEEMRSYKRHRK